MVGVGGEAGSEVGWLTMDVDSGSEMDLGSQQQKQRYCLCLTFWYIVGALTLKVV